MLKSSSAIWLSVLLLFIPGCGPFTSWQDDQKTAQRVQDFPTQGLDLKAPARIYFDEHQIPFIEAGHDDDLPYLLGMVHAHLRLAQMEVFRRAVPGTGSPRCSGPLLPRSTIQPAHPESEKGGASDRPESLPPGDPGLWLQGFSGRA